MTPLFSKQYLWEVYNRLASSPMGSNDREVLQLIPIAQLCGEYQVQKSQ